MRSLLRKVGTGTETCMCVKSSQYIQLTQLMFRVIIKLCGVIWSNAILLLHVYVKDNVIHSLSCFSLKEDGTMATCSSGSNSGKSER